MQSIKCSKYYIALAGPVVIQHVRLLTRPVRVGVTVGWAAINLWGSYIFYINLIEELLLPIKLARLKFVDELDWFIQQTSNIHIHSPADLLYRHKAKEGAQTRGQININMVVLQSNWSKSLLRSIIHMSLGSITTSERYNRVYKEVFCFVRMHIVEG